MCTFDNDPRLKKPRKEKIVAYKVFDKGKNVSIEIPVSFTGEANFKFGWNKWDEKRARRDENRQSGFQLFTRLKDAKKYVDDIGGYDDLICPITVYTKDIVKMTNDFWSEDYRVFEVTAFAIWKKDWNAARKKNWSLEKAR